jgi:undecaprenyl-diphosphatase
MTHPDHALPDPVIVATGRRWSRGDTTRVLAAAGVLGAGALLARDGVPDWERHLFEWLNQAPDVLYPVIWPIMQLGSLAGGILVATVVGVRTRRISVGACTLGAVVSAWWVGKMIKDAVGRARPEAAGVPTEIRGDAPLGLGFVSGHTAVAFALYAMVVPHLTPRWKLVALGLALLVGLARVYVGAHLPLDIFGGAALGLMVGEAFRVLETVWRGRHGGKVSVASGPATA